MIEHSSTKLSLKDITAVIRVLKSRQINDSSETVELESDLQKYFESRAVRLLPSGTRALISAIEALKTEISEYVVIPSYVCEDILHSVYAVNLKPIVCDVNPLDFNIEAQEVLNRIEYNSTESKKIAAIVVPHMFGFPADVLSLQKLQIPIIEDITHAIGGKINNQLVGTFGNISISSLHALKVITAGEGGFLLVNQRENLKFKEYGDHLSNINSALARSQLSRINDILKIKSEIYNYYKEKTREIFGNSVNIQERLRGHPAYFKFVVLLPDYLKYEEIQIQYQNAGIVVRKPVKVMLHKLVPNIDSSQFQVTERIFKNALSLPLHLNLTNRDLKKIVTTTEKIFKDKLSTT